MKLRIKTYVLYYGSPGKYPACLKIQSVSENLAIMEAKRLVAECYGSNHKMKISFEPADFETAPKNENFQVNQKICKNAQKNLRKWKQ